MPHRLHVHTVSHPQSQRALSAEATEFKKQYEKSMEENEPLLADAPPADVKEDPDAAEKAEQDKKTGEDADALADKVAETKV